MKDYNIKVEKDKDGRMLVTFEDDENKKKSMVFENSEKATHFTYNLRVAIYDAQIESRINGKTTVEWEHPSKFLKRGC